MPAIYFVQKTSNACATVVWHRSLLRITNQRKKATRLQVKSNAYETAWFYKTVLCICYDLF